MFRRETPFAGRGMLVNFGNILPETSKSSACWDMGGNSHLTWLSSDSLYLPQLIELKLESKEVASSIHIIEVVGPFRPDKSLD